MKLKNIFYCKIVIFFLHNILICMVQNFADISAINCFFFISAPSLSHWLCQITNKQQIFQVLFDSDLNTYQHNDNCTLLHSRHFKKSFSFLKQFPYKSNVIITRFCWMLYIGGVREDIRSNNDEYWLEYIQGIRTFFSNTKE